MNTFKTCKIEGCVKHVVAFDLCCTHYSKFKKYGDPLAGRTNSGGMCSVDGCDKPAKGLKLCPKHYERFKKHGDPLIARGVRKIKPPKPKEPKDPNAPKRISNRKKIDRPPCHATGCGRISQKNGLCLKHYGRLRRLGVLETGRPDRLPNLSQKVCKIEGCGKNAMALHLCPNHYRKLKLHGDPLGGGTQDGRSKVWHVRDNGYVMRFEIGSPHCGKNGIVYQHRQVMGEHIGRPLLPNENVHHKNGDRADNSLENLELWSTSQPCGQRVADKVKWAREMFALYGHLDV